LVIVGCWTGGVFAVLAFETGFGMLGERARTKNTNNNSRLSFFILEGQLPW